MRNRAVPTVLLTVTAMTPTFGVATNPGPISSYKRYS